MNPLAFPCPVPVSYASPWKGEKWSLVVQSGAMSRTLWFHTKDDALVAKATARLFGLTVGQVLDWRERAAFEEETNERR